MRKLLFVAVGLLVLLTSCALNTVPVVIQFDSSCEWEELVPGDIKLKVENKEFVLIGTDIDPDDIEELRQDLCVQKALPPQEMRAEIETLQKELDAQRDRKIEELQLDRTLIKKDIIDEEQLQTIIEEENPEETWPGGIISPYQLYVTPDAEAVQQVAAKLNGIQEIYEESLSWIWISEETLNHVEEKWLYPEEFLMETPEYPTNPTNEIASDCEEQANTLVSALIADGHDPQNVRVVLGIVNFGGQIGGHAWVQVYEEGQWLDVEATAGLYYDDATGTITGATYLPYDYFKYHNYPSLQVWFYYNNQYFMDARTGAGNAPSHWSETGGSRLQRDLEAFSEGRMMQPHPTQPGLSQVISPLRNA